MISTGSIGVDDVVASRIVCGAIGGLTCDNDNDGDVAAGATNDHV
jgi:hypothetical protein